MASSRLERLGTIFTRISSLIKCGAMSSSDKPLWYEIYQVYPPIDEPSYSRRVPIKKIKPIFYPEDRIRAKFHQGNYVQSIKIENLEGGATTSDITQRVISLTADIMKEESNLNDEVALKKAVEKLIAENAFKAKTPKSMFKPSHRKTANVTTSIDMVNLPHQVDSSTLKNIAQKDIDVSILVDQEEEDDFNFKRDSVLKDFKNASKKMSEKKLNIDDSSKEE